MDYTAVNADMSFTMGRFAGCKVHVKELAKVLYIYTFL